MLPAFATWMKAERQKKRLTQQELARVSGVSTACISTIERGLREPMFTTAVKLAWALDVEFMSVAMLLKGSS